MVIFLGAFARNFFAFVKSSLLEIIIPFSGQDDGGRSKALPPHEIIIPITNMFFLMYIFFFYMIEIILLFL